MLAAARISNLLGFLDRSDETAHRVLLERNCAPTSVSDLADVEQIMHFVRLDNKRGYLPSLSNKCDFILLDALGKPHSNDGGLIVQVDEEVVRDALESLVVSKATIGVM